ncbi:AAA family ATPase [Fredinandcohnia sp. 179-A 10B2 NHS]|uniref:ATP-binding protein n=1 Tax=Fredinandcohnia sp. 179-A 10B2 NHS TaxID=3235176 RepID=UPI0039A0A0BF
MKIIGIQIYGYGKLENREFQLSPTFQTFYGENEAGKSTIMSFIHSILFGFPTKAQQEQRYVPKSGAKYGGKLIVETEQYGTLMVERLPGKAAGDVSVYLPDGTVAGEEFLAELFRGMDKSLYQNIYSFNIHGLQGVHQLRSEDVGRFLFSSGVVGTDALLSLENKLIKEMDGIFKPSGKKPLLNHEIAMLKEEHANILKWQNQNNEYLALLDRKSEVDESLEHLELHKALLQSKIKEAERLQSIQPLLEEYKTLERHLEKLPSYEPFPEAGIKRLDQLQSQLKPYEAQLSALTQKVVEWEQSMTSIELNYSYLENEQAINELSKNKSLYNEKKNNATALKNELLSIEDEMTHLKNRLNMVVSDEELLLLDTSISAKDLFSEITSEFERSKQRKQFLDENFIRAKEALETNETKLKEYQKQVLSEDERKRCEQAARSQSQRSDLEKEKEYIEEEINRIDLKIKGSQKKRIQTKRKLQFLLGGIGAAIMLALIFSFMKSDWLFGGFFTLLLVLLFPFGTLLLSQFSSGVGDLKEERDILSRKLVQIQEQLQSTVYNHDTEASNRLIRDQQVRQQIEIEKSSLMQNERAYNKVVEAFEQWEKGQFAIEEKAKQCRVQYGISEQITNERLMDAFLILESLKERVLKKRKLEVQIKETLEAIKGYQKRVAMIIQKVNLQVDNYSSAVEKLIIHLQEEKKKQEKVFDDEGKIKDASDRMSQLKFEIKHIMSECQTLWDHANVNNEEEFRAKGQSNEVAKGIKEKLILLQAQLDRFETLVDKCELDENYQTVIEETTEEIKQTTEKEKGLQLQRSEINYRIKELEDGGTYADVLHSFEAKKTAAKEFAKKWAAHAVAKDILTKTIKQYREIRLPMVIAKAETYFSILTNGKYNRIFSESDSESFLVEGTNGIRYKPIELSQATAEQLYIALRFALAHTMHPNVSFPFIIDDSFVNFDSERLDYAISLIQELSKDHQVLLFTCHQHVLEKCKDSKPILLGQELTYKEIY